MRFVTTSVCLSRRPFFLLYMWRPVAAAEGACWLGVVRDTEKCFLPEAAASEMPIPVPPFKSHLACLVGKSVEKVYLRGAGTIKKKKKKNHSFVWSLFLRSLFGINWQCGLSDVGFWMGLWMWEAVTFWERHSSIGQQTQVTSWESIWYDW